MDSFSFILILFGAAVLLNVVIGKSRKSQKDLNQKRKDIIDRQKDQE